MPDLTEPERTVLALAAGGMSVAAIGHWEEATDSLVAKGLLHRFDKFNNVITPQGGEVWVGLEAADDALLLGAMRRERVIEGKVTDDTPEERKREGTDAP